VILIRGCPVTCYTANEALKYVIKEERKPSVIIPTDPQLNISKQLDLPVLGTEINNVADLDKRYLANKAQFCANATTIR
jgi:hypothetical protein